MDTQYRANIILLGRSGAGKSELINYLLGAKVASTGCGEPVTTSFDEYEYDMRNGLKIRIFDSRGLEVDKYKEISDDIISFIKSRYDSTDVQDWFHAIYYCINIGRHRIEPVEEMFIKKLMGIANIPIQIIITHCKTPVLSENQQVIINRAGMLIGNAESVHCINSIEVKQKNGTLLRQFGKERIINSIVESLWTNTARRIAINYSEDIYAGLMHIADELEKKGFYSIDTCSREDLEECRFPQSIWEESAKNTTSFINTMNSMYEKRILTFIELYCRVANTMAHIETRATKPFTLLSYAILDNAIEEELQNSFLRLKANFPLPFYDYYTMIRYCWKYMVCSMCNAMRSRIPDKSKIVAEVYSMFKEAMDYCIINAPKRRTFDKIGPNDYCPCGSGKKYKKCCMGNGYFD